jgi:hypothetical protein
VPTVWSPTGAPSLLPGLPSGGSIFGLSPGYAVGTFFGPTTFNGGILRGSTFTSLASPAGGGYSAAYGVNSLGIACGAGYYPDNTTSTGTLWWGNRRIFVTRAPQDSYLDNVNNLGWSVGGIGTPTQHRGLLFAQGRVYDVNTLLAPSQQTWQITNVNDVNDDGEMVGSAFDGTGVQHAILLTPLP